MIHRNIWVNCFGLFACCSGRLCLCNELNRFFMMMNFPHNIKCVCVRVCFRVLYSPLDQTIVYGPIMELVYA